MGTVAAVVGALAALAVFAWPTADGRLSHDDSTRTTSGTPAVTGGDPTTPVTPSATSPGPTPAPGPAGSRKLVTLAPATGIGSAQSRGDDILVACPSNQSDDRYRELRYELVAPYGSLTTGVGVSGPGDPDATAAVQVFVQRRQERSDRIVEVRRAVVHAGEKTPLAAPIGDAAAVVLRVTCAAPGQTVTLTDPHLTR